MTQEGAEAKKTILGRRREGDADRDIRQKIQRTGNGVSSACGGWEDENGRASTCEEWSTITG